jgi:hypothetical protein
MTMRTLIASLAILALPALVRAEAPALDGRTFVVEGGEKGKPAEKQKDDVIFKAGKFRSTGCDPYGFAEAPYQTKKEGGAIAFESSTTSAKEGKIHWKGNVQGDAISGSYVWSKPGQKDIEYWFKGTAKK